MTVLELENCPSFITYSQVEKRRILEMLSNMVLSSKNVKLSKVREFFFARFLIMTFNIWSDDTYLECPRADTRRWQRLREETRASRGMP